MGTPRKENTSKYFNVGYYGTGYVEKRLLTDIPLTSARLVRMRDIFNAITYAQRKLYRPPSARELLNCLHYDWGRRDIHLVHLINTLSLSQKRWVVTYEHWLPRWNEDSAFGWKLLASPACRKLIAISAWAQRYQESLFARHPEHEEAIRPKMCILPPAQFPLISSYDEKVLDPRKITFAFVGADFFRKGGLEVLEVLSPLVAEGLPIHLTVVSSFLYGDYASHSTEADLRRAKELMASMGTAVTYHPYLGNDRVTTLLTGTHVALFPTYDETYGFFGLEGQAAGCPVITTDGCALTEYNDDTRGWLMAVPKNDLQQPLHRTKEQRAILSQCIRERLTQIVRGICADPSSVRRKGELALEYIKTERSPAQNAVLLESIYLEALA
jgi:glycosyltransferase involved in cell wall biosynthesis